MENGLQCSWKRGDLEFRWRRKWQPTPVFLLENPQTWSLLGYIPQGRKIVGHDPATEQQQEMVLGNLWSE